LKNPKIFAKFFNLNLESSFDSTSMSFEKIDEFLNEKDPQILTSN